jgi:predicted glycosyltransferase
MLMRRSRKFDALAIEGGGVWQAAAGETHEIACVDLPPICAQPKGRLSSNTMLKGLHLTKIRLNNFGTCHVGRTFSMRAERT